jgi:hypothetical protein
LERPHGQIGIGIVILDQEDRLLVEHHRLSPGDRLDLPISPPPASRYCG